MADMDPIQLIDNLRDEIKMDKKECQNEALTLIKKIFTVIDTYTDTPSFNKRLDDLTKDICGLKEKLADVTKERDNLLDTVENMKLEIKELSTKLLPPIQPFQQPITVQNQKQHHSQGIQHVNGFSRGNVNPRGQGKAMQSYPFEIAKQPTQNSLNDPYDSDDYDFNAEADVDIKEVVSNEVMHGKLGGNDHPRVEHNNMKDNLDHNVENVTSYEVNQDLPAIEHKYTLWYSEGVKQFKCNECHYSTRQVQHMKSHIQGVHMKLKNHHCEECGFAATKRSGVQRHWDAVHNKGDKKFKCGRCPYSSAERSKLKKHVSKLHDMVGSLPVKNKDAQN